MNGSYRAAASSFIDDAAGPDGRDLTAGRSRPLAGWRGGWLALALLAASTFFATDAAAQIVAGPNVNIGGGPACSRAEDPGCPFQVFGDVSIQRQNEGSMACSSRNPQTCLAAGNDYRLNGLPGVNDGKVTADAWLGIFWSRNGGQAWRSTLLPGWKTTEPSVKDTTPEGAPAVNPIAGFEAAADPTLRAGTHGLFYLSGIAFNRAEETNGATTALSAGGEGKSGVQFASVFIDDNDSSDPNKPPRYLRTAIVDSGTSGRFLDKPWIIADIPRGLATCTIPAGPNGTPAAQTIQTGMVYVAYATFLGSGNNPHSDIWVRSSNNCGASWSNGTKVTASVPLNQSPMIVLNPVNGSLYVVWREFGQNGLADRILMASSTNAARTFSKVTEVASLGVPQLPANYSWPSPVSTAFDQTTLPNNNIADVRMARTNGYPSACVGSDGVLRVAYSKRIPQPGAPPGAIEFARIMFARLDGNSWSAAAIDNHAGPGHQFQPAIACTGTRATAIWYDQRGDAALSQPLLPWVFFPFIIDPMAPPPAHTIDVRAVQTSAAGTFQPGSSIQVSKYPLAYDTATQQFVQLQYNFLNWALFGGGVVPFLGDYLEAVPKNPFTPPLCANAACTQLTGWTFNTFANESPLVHGLWTDNRDVLQTSDDVASIDWTNYAAPGGAACTPTSLTWTRNQNLYTSLLGAGFVLQAEGNARRTKDLEKRAYVVQLQNLVPPVAGQNATLRKRFRLTFGALSGEASFSFATDFTSLSAADFLATYGRAANPVVNTVFVDVPYASGAVRTVFVRKDSTAPVVVIGEEVRAFANDGSLIPIDSCALPSAPCALLAGGSKSRVIVAPDPQAPVQALTEESHDADFTILPVLTPGSPTPVNSVTYPYPLISSSVVLNDPNFSNNLLNPTWTSPTWTSPTWTNPTWTSPTWTNPTWTSPTWTSPTWTSPTWTSPTWTSPTWTSPTWTSQVITETSYLAQGTGSVTSGYDLDSLILSLPQGAIMQTLVSKVTTVPGTNTCTPGMQVILQPVANVTSLNGLSNTSFSLAPGEQAIVTLRVACDAANGACYTPSANTSVVLTKQAPDCTTSPELVNPDLPKCEQPTTDRFDIFDTAAPTIDFSPAAPANVVQGTSPAGVVVPYAASASDAVDALLGISVAIACTKDGQPVPSSSTTTLFGYGTTTITCTSTDSHGNSVTTNFTITVVDTVPPVVNVPGSVSLEATSAAGATYSFTASALDGVDGALTPVCTPASGSTFTVGTTTVTCSATDSAGNTGNGSFVVTVVDTVDPVLVVPANIATLVTPGGTTASITYTASATDLGQNVVVTCSSAAGSVSSFPATQLFSAGTTVVTCVADDGRGNTATATFTVTVALTYGILGPLSPYQAPPKTYNSGSSVPIAWKYTVAGVAVATPFPAWQPQVKFVKVLNWRNCANSGTESTAPQDTFVNTETPGNWYFMYSSTTLTWKLNWDSPAQPNTCWNIYIGTADRSLISVGRLQLK